MRDSDSDLRIQIEAAVATILPSNIRVSVRDGRAELRGVVVSEEHLERAKAALRLIPVCSLN